MPELRSVEIATRALLGFDFEVAFGTTLATDGVKITIPTPAMDRTEPWHLLLTLQAGSIASLDPRVQDLSPWHPTLLNLRAARQLRQRFPGLRRQYLAMEEWWWSQISEPALRGRDPGSLVLSWLLTALAPQRDAPVPGHLSAKVAEVEAWLEAPYGPWPAVDFPLPLEPLPYLATVSSRVMPASPTLGAQLGRGSSDALVRPQPEAARLSRILIIPPERPAVSGPGVLRSTAAGTPEQGSSDTVMGEACRHDEWDFEHESYRDAWCSVYNTMPASSGHATVPTAVSAAALRRVRRLFERQSTRSRVRPRESDGPELDLDAVVAAWPENRGSGVERLYLAAGRDHRETAIAVVADLSESTSGWTLELERVALLLLGEALRTVGDPFGLFGFQGRGRENCRLVWIKDFDEPFGRETRTRIGRLNAWGYTRIAPYLRHVGEILADTESRRQILFLITDGMPYDTAGYGGRYAVEDTRRAFAELRARGVKSYCLTIDFAANQYLSRMCGSAAWTLVNRRERLPDALLELYRRVRL